MLYWCEEEAQVDFEYVEGKCYVTYVDEPDANVEEYTRGGPHRFYFREVRHFLDQLPHIFFGKRKAFRGRPNPYNPLIVETLMR